MEIRLNAEIEKTSFRRSGAKLFKQRFGEVRIAVPFILDEQNKHFTVTIADFGNGGRLYRNYLHDITPQKNRPKAAKG